MAFELGILISIVAIFMGIVAYRIILHYSVGSYDWLKNMFVGKNPFQREIDEIEVKGKKEEALAKTEIQLIDQEENIGKSKLILIQNNLGLIQTNKQENISQLISIIDSILKIIDQEIIIIKGLIKKGNEELNTIKEELALTQKEIQDEKKTNQIFTKEKDLKKVQELKLNLAKENFSKLKKIHSILSDSWFWGTQLSEAKKERALLFKKPNLQDLKYIAEYLLSSENKILNLQKECKDLELRLLAANNQSKELLDKHSKEIREQPELEEEQLEEAA